MAVNPVEETGKKANRVTGDRWQRCCILNTTVRKNNTVLSVSLSHAILGPTYNEKIVDLKFRFNWGPVFLLSNLSNPSNFNHVGLRPH